MTNNKYTIPIIIIISLILFNIYSYNSGGKDSEYPIIIAAIIIGAYKGIIVENSKDIFNLYRIKGKDLLKDRFRVLELIVAILIVISTSHDSYKNIESMFLSNVMLVFVYDIIFVFIFFRFFTFNLFGEEACGRDKVDLGKGR